MKFKLLFSLILLCSVVLANGSFDIHYLTNNDGLSNSSVNTIFQDSNEILWFGTWDGLNMYNGVEFKVYKPEPGNPSSISSNIIRDIVEVEGGVLWIATDLGINRFSLKERVFKRYFVDTIRSEITNEHSYLIAVDGSGRLFASVYQQGLYYYNPENEQFIHLDIGQELNIKSMVFDDQDQLWILTSEKDLYRVNFSEEAFIPEIRNISPLPLMTGIESLFYKDVSGVVLQTQDHSIYRYDREKGTLSPFGLKNPGIGSLRDIDCRDSVIYLGTDSGLYGFDLNGGDLLTVMEGRSVLSVFAGTQSILWVGTDTQGVCKIVQPEKKFITYSPDNVPGFGRSAVRTFSEDESGNLWVGTKGSGIYIFSRDETSGRLMLKDHYEREQGLASNSVYEIVAGSDGILWIGSDGNSINYFDSDTDAMHRLIFSDDLNGKINLSSVYAILPDGDSTLWVGTSGYGMYKLEIDDSSHPYRIVSYKQFIYRDGIQSLSNNIVYSIIRDDSTHLNIATRGGGVNRFNVIDETFEVIKFSKDNPDYLGSDDVLCLYKDGDGSLWAGTSMGLYRMREKGYDEEGELQIVNFNEQTGMPNNTIHGILQDQLNNLWISTNNGIAKLYNAGDSEMITTYFAIDGLQNNEFSDGAYYASPGSSSFYFGGINGFNEFNPLSVVHDISVPKLLLDAFYADNEEYNLTDFLVEREDREVLTLSYDNKSFSFHFTNVDYLTGSKCEISYILEGYQSDWVDLGRSNTIVFSNLSKGDYLLKVRNSNAYGVWSDTCFTLPIKVNPPWWETNIAYSIYLLLFILAAWGIWKAMSYRMKVKEENRMKELDKQKTEEIHQAKLSFFTNIAHEFSNSLTLIYSPCEKLLQERQSDNLTRKYVQIIKSNSERMHTLIQQLIEFRKADSGHLKLNIEVVDIQEIIKFILDNFLDMLEQKKIECTISSTPENIQWQTDRDSIEKILFNLISNAVKYTPENERITVVTEIKDEMLSICVTNTGVGIKAEFREQIFDRFEVLNRFEKQVSFTMQSRHGIGLAICKSLTEVLHGDICVESDGESYTSFIVHLPSLPLTAKAKLYEEEESAIIPHHTGLTLTDTMYEKGLDEESLAEQPVVQTIADDEHRGVLILIVEDDTQIRMMIKELLHDNYDIIEASNGKEAVEMTNQYLPQLIICDIIMPVMDGVEFVKIIRSQNHTRHIPIIFLTSKSDIESQIEGYETGADAYLSKPFSVRHLEVLIQSLLDKTKRLSEYSRSPASAVEHFEGKLIHKEDKELLIRITGILQDNISNENLSISFLANEIAMSKMQLYRKIKELTGLTPTEYIRSVRLRYAEKLLKTTTKTVQEIIYLSGFNNKAYFYREFAKKHNKTPLEYRKYRNNNE